MKSFRIILVLAIFLFFIAPGFAQQTGKQFEIKSGLHYNYLVYLPTQYGQAGKQWPLMFFLHGAGERGTDLSLVKKNGPASFVDNERIMTRRFGEGGFPFILVSPQCPAGEWWLNSYLIEIMNEVLKTYSIDHSHMYCTGLSMGGFGTWSFASEYPQLFAAIAPICGGGDAMAWSGIKSYTNLTIPAANIKNLVDIPVWAFHGEADTTVNIKEDQKTVDELRALGGDVTFTTYPGVGHDAWTTTYSNADLYTWLLSHSTTTSGTQSNAAETYK